jgi:hypothetical protein
MLILQIQCKWYGGKNEVVLRAIGCKVGSALKYGTARILN